MQYQGVSLPQVLLCIDPSHCQSYFPLKKKTFHYILFNIKQNYFGILIAFAQKSKNLNCVWSFTIQLHLLMQPRFSSHHFFCPYPLHLHCLPCAPPGTFHSFLLTRMFQVFPQHMPLHMEFNLLASLLQSPVNSCLILLRPSWVLTPLPFGVSTDLIQPPTIYLCVCQQLC